MPRKADCRTKGDLYLQFNIIFPNKFKAKYKDEIVDILRRNAPDPPLEESKGVEFPQGFKETFSMVMSRHNDKPDDVKAKSEAFMATIAGDSSVFAEYKGRRESFFLKADLNNDGMLNLDEFKAFMNYYSDWEQE